MRPSSVLSGGICTSTMATSGLWLRPFAEGRARRRLGLRPRTRHLRAGAPFLRGGAPGPQRRRCALGDHLTRCRREARAAPPAGATRGLPLAISRAPPTPRLSARGSTRPASNQDDRRSVVVRAQFSDQREAVGVGQIDVEQHRLGTQPARRGQAAGAVPHNPDDLVPACLQQRPSTGSHISSGGGRRWRRVHG